MSQSSRTDRLVRELLAQVERQRPLLDGGGFNQVTITVRLHRDGNVRGVQVRLEAECVALSEPERER